MTISSRVWKKINMEKKNYYWNLVYEYKEPVVGWPPVLKIESFVTLPSRRKQCPAFLLCVYYFFLPEITIPQ